VQQTSIVDLFSEAERLERLQQLPKVVELYKAWIAANPGNELLHAVYFNYGVSLSKLGDRPGAINALRECIRLKPDFYPPYINLGRLLEDLGQLGSAVGQWMALVNSLPNVNGDSVRHKLMALQQMGRVLEGANRDAAAEDALKQSLEINPAQGEVVQHWIALRQRQCKWPVVEGWEHVDTKTLMRHISPLSLAALADDPMFQLARAYRYAKDTIGVPPSGPRRRRVHVRRPSRKLRIGYVSSDLREHAVGFAMTDVLETHDKTQFEIYAYYCGISRTDATQTRIKNCVDRWFDINGLSDEDAADRIVEDQIDILVDLNGYTRDARTRIFALRPAPVIVNWFGFPGTMGTPYHNYIIADPHIIPESHDIYYSEKVLRLPCYQPNDRKRVVANRTPTRREEGLPEDAFVYCCLNGLQKVTPGVFRSWMSILSQVPGSVLWLLGGTEDTRARLCGMAEDHGVAGQRLIFAHKRPNPEHIARYALADLFLDTYPYGAHTTAADAMWMGVPVLTIPGRSFASRVCTSLVQAAGMADFVCTTPEAYVGRAIEMGRSRDKVAAAKRRLKASRDTCLLFDTPTLTERLEGLFRHMWREFEAGALPIPDLTNLDVYFELGLELNAKGFEAPSDEEYRRIYSDGLVAWHRVYPTAVDGRLWKRAS
jgi:predicted O-linked N-acetylglucosamine transferase (SPINDLY family)